MKSFVLLLLIVAYASAESDYVRVRFHIKDGRAFDDLDGTTCDDSVDGKRNPCDTYAKIEINGEEVYRTNTEDNTDSPRFNETFTTGLIRRNSIIKVILMDSDEGSSDDDIMSVFKGNVDYFLNHQVFKDKKNSLKMTTKLVGENGKVGEKIQISIKFESAEAVVDIDGNAFEAKSTYSVIIIEGKEVFKTKTVDYNANFTYGQTYTSESMSVRANVDIKLYGVNGAPYQPVLLSAWSETAENIAELGETTLSGNKTTSNHRNSLKIRTKRIKGGDTPCGCNNDTATCDNSKQNSYATANMKAGKCSTTASCYNGKCWAYCGQPDLASGQWCYTSKGAPQSGEYVECTDDSECNPCWNCGGPCGN